MCQTTAVHQTDFPPLVTSSLVRRDDGKIKMQELVDQLTEMKQMMSLQDTSELAGTLADLTAALTKSLKPPLEVVTSRIPETPDQASSLAKFQTICNPKDTACVIAAYKDRDCFEGKRQVLLAAITGSCFASLFG